MWHLREIAALISLGGAGHARRGPENPVGTAIDIVLTYDERERLLAELAGLFTTDSASAVVLDALDALDGLGYDRRFRVGFAAARPHVVWRETLQDFEDERVREPQRRLRPPRRFSVSSQASMPSARRR